MTNTSTVQAPTTTWELDPAHSSVEFSVKHMMMTTVRGRFKNARATVVADEAHPETARVEVEIDVAS
ncbi:MAG: YceI family protein, partial [Gemmatimonadaceae bacterium]